VSWQPGAGGARNWGWGRWVGGGGYAGGGGDGPVELCSPKHSTGPYKPVCFMNIRIASSNPFCMSER
jgi:hypothetical protein